MRSLTKSVYDYPGSGDKGQNNGQVWEGIRTDDGWSTERSLRNKCREELDSDWDKRIAQVKGEPSASGWLQEQFSASLKKGRRQTSAG